MIIDKTLKFSRNKIIATTIAIFLISIMTSSVVLMPVATAHTPPINIQVWIYCSVGNRVLGVGQSTIIVFWCNEIPPGAQGEYGDRWTYTVTAMKPDGTNDTLGPFTSDPVGGSYTEYTPTEVGTYAFIAHFPAHVLVPGPQYPGFTGNVYFNDTFGPADSAPVSMTVQQDPIKSWPDAPIPTDYWTVPVNEANPLSYTLVGNWLAGAAQNVGPTVNYAYGAGPKTAHVMWTKPVYAGGIMDERFGTQGYTTGSYEGLIFTPPIILNGYLYYNAINQMTSEGWTCVNLYTGATAYTMNTTGPVTGKGSGFDAPGAIAGDSLSFGQILNYESPNQHGGYSYLWSTTGMAANSWDMFDSFTGDYICSIANVTQSTRTLAGTTVTTGATGTAVYGADGSILRYNIVNLGTTAKPQTFLQVWNTTQAIWFKPQGWGTSNNYWMWRPYLNWTFDGNYGFSLNASIPNVTGTIYAVREGQYVIGGSAGKQNTTTTVPGYLWALNLDPSKGAIGSLLYNTTFTPPLQTADDISASQQSAGIVTLDCVVPEQGVFIFSEKATNQRWGYSLATGNLLWGPSAPEEPFNYYGMSFTIYQGMDITWGYGGQLRAYNLTTGEILWQYNATSIGFESFYGGNYPIWVMGVCNGMIYLGSSEHSVSQPMWRGSYVRCINTTDGTEIWKMLDWHDYHGSMGISNGYLVDLNMYDNSLYCYGKGPSSTTVQTTNDIITAGNDALIKGTVMDTSTGAQATGQKLGYENGVPAVSDSSEEAWMEYIYEQQNYPTNATGVPVNIDAVDPNGNFIHLGTTTSDTSGFYSLPWTTPDIPGKYTIIATFPGTNAYGSSYAETALDVKPASATPAPTAQPLNELTMNSTIMTYTAVAAIAIIIAIAIVGALTILVLRKRA